MPNAIEIKYSGKSVSGGKQYHVFVDGRFVAYINCIISDSFFAFHYDANNNYTLYNSLEEAKAAAVEKFSK